jgi:hypothetical protein
MNRDFKGIWIPKEVWLDERLTALDKMILMEIDSLDVGEEGCYASNNHLAEFCQCTETKVSLSIKKLIDLDYIEIISFDGRKRYIKMKRQTLKKLKADFKKIKERSIDKINNNKLLFINNSTNIKKFKKPTLEEIEKYCKERKNNVDAEKFFNYYESNGWKVGKNSMKDWKAAVRTWERNNYDKKDSKKQEVIYDII